MDSNHVGNVSQVEHPSVASTTSTGNESFLLGKRSRHYHNLSKSAGRYSNASIQPTISSLCCHCRARSYSMPWTDQATTQPMACHHHQFTALPLRTDYNHRLCPLRNRALLVSSRCQREMQNGMRNAEGGTQFQSKQTMSMLYHSQSIDRHPTWALLPSRQPSWSCSESSPVFETR